MSVKISLPLTVVIPRKRTIDKKFRMNLNEYRNTHFHVLDDVKKAYVDLVREVCSEKDFVGMASPFSFSYTVYPQTSRAMDLGNVLSVVQKFAEDALVEIGCIPDDNHNVIDSVTYAYGGVDKENPRVDLVIHESRH